MKLSKEQIEAISLEIHRDLLPMLRDGKIPDHEHWEDPETCGNLRWLIAAIIQKHAGKEENKIP